MEVLHKGLYRVYGGQLDGRRHVPAEPGHHLAGPARNQRCGRAPLLPTHQGIPLGEQAHRHDRQHRPALLHSGRAASVSGENHSTSFQRNVSQTTIHHDPVTVCFLSHPVFIRIHKST